MTGILSNIKKQIQYQNLEDFKNTVADYLAWEVSNLLKNENKEDDEIKK